MAGLTGAGLRVGITQRCIGETPTSFARDALDAAWSGWFARHLPEALFTPVPNFAQPAQALAYCRAWDLNALVLSGGEDIGVSPRRDEVERALLAFARDAKLAVLGVCRGMQFLHHFSGGRLEPVAEHVGQVHEVNVEGEVLQLNSWHRWRIDEPTAGWEATGRSREGHVEAMRHRTLPWLATMWHPERPHGGADLVAGWLAAAAGKKA